jgi:hypothetical protein
MLLDGMPGRTPKKSNPWVKAAFAGALLLLALLFIGYLGLKIFLDAPREAPEAERVLSAQADLPFQVLIPAYLPKQFNREKMELITAQLGPQGEAMVQLVYKTRQGNSLTISEWLPSGQGSGQVAAHVMSCLCVCLSGGQCNMTGMELVVGQVRVKVEFSAPNILTYNEFQFVLETLGPAANSQVYASIEDVPLSFSVPPAVEIPVNAEGVQELTLVVSPQGYTPVHFSVKKDIPVRLVFRQLGQVGCGNELILQWSARKSATLLLASPSDEQVLEFTPAEAGEFRFHCPHYIYQGVMTVLEE